MRLFGAILLHKKHEMVLQVMQPDVNIRTLDSQGKNFATCFMVFQRYVLLCSRVDDRAASRGKPIYTS